MKTKTIAIVEALALSCLMLALAACGSSGSGSDELTTVVVNSPGVIAGAGNSGCKFFGTVEPRARGNLYDLSVSFSGPCPSAASSVAGVAYFDSSAKRLYVAALNQSRTNGLIFTGMQP